MTPRWIRPLIVLATMLAAWLLATPARAAAPLCDDRGATVLAPPPQLQPIETSIDVGDSDVCGSEDVMTRAVHPGGTPEFGPAPETLATLLTTALAVLPIDAQDMTWLDRTSYPSCGVPRRLDRPPRA